MRVRVCLFILPFLAPVATDVSADEDLRIKAAWNPSQSWNPRVIPRLPQTSEPAIHLANDCDDPAALFRRRFDLAWPATPGRIPDADMDGRRGFEKRASPASHSERRSEDGASTAGLPVTAAACLLMIDYRVEACAAVPGMN